MSRRDIKPGSDAPKAVRDHLLKIGGKNPYGEPNWRLTLASGTLWYVGAEWHEYRDGASGRDKGGYMLVDENGMEFRRPPDTPLRIVPEMRWVRRYPPQRHPKDPDGVDGWILQEWQPAHTYGPRDEWYKQHVPNHPDLCRCGPYPERGDYELKFPAGVPFVPPLSALSLAVNYAERSREFWGGFTPKQRFQMREDFHKAQLIQREKHDHDRDIDMIRDSMSPLWSNTLEAGRWRSDMAAKAGLDIGHVGN